MWPTNMAAGNQRKHLEITLLWKRSLLAHEIKYMCMNTSPNVLERLKMLRFMGIDNFFFQPNSFVSWCHARLQMQYHRNKRPPGTAGNLKKIYF